MKATESEEQALISAYKQEKDADVCRRLQLAIHVRIDDESASEAAQALHMSRSWGTKWAKRYADGGIEGLQNRPRTGRPASVPRGIMRRVRRRARKTKCWTPEEMRDLISQMTGRSFEISYVRKIMKKWGYVMKVPVLRYVSRPSVRSIRRFQKRIRRIIAEAEADGYTVCKQDETIAVADARARKEVYTLQSDRAVYTYTGGHSKTIVFGIITAKGEGYFERHSKFNGEAFVAFLKNACQEREKLLMILDRAPQHRAKVVLDAVKELGGQVRLEYLPPGCPDLNAIEEVWRQMKMGVLSGPYVKFSKMCSDIDEWLESRLPQLDIYRYLYRSV